MRIGLSSYTYTWAVGVSGFDPAEPLTAVGLIHRAAELGVRVVQFADNLPLHALSHRELVGVRSESLERGVAIEVGTRGIGELLDDYLRLASMFGSPFVRLVIDSEGDEPHPDDVVGRLSRFEAPFREAGVKLAIENHDRLPVAALVGIVKQLGDWTGICLDTVNSLGCAEGPVEVVAALGPHILNLHIKDFVVRRHAHHMGFEVVGTPAGKGQLDLPWLLGQLGHRAHELTGILELWTPPGENLESTIRTEEEWARESVTYLRGLSGLT